MAGPGLTTTTVAVPLAEQIRTCLASAVPAAALAAALFTGAPAHEHMTWHNDDLSDDGAILASDAWPLPPLHRPAPCCAWQAPTSSSTAPPPRTASTAAPE